MKHILTSLVLVVLLFPTLALGEEITMDDLVIREGIYYQKFHNVPFDGEVTGQRQGSFRDGIKDGSWVKYGGNGQLWEKGTYKDGKKEGPWVYYHDNGQLWKRGTFKDGKREGSWVGYHDNGQLEFKGTYRNGKKEGEWVTHWNNGQLREKGAFRIGKKEGLWVFYKEDGIKNLTGGDSYLGFHQGSGLYKNGVKVSD